MKIDMTIEVSKEELKMFKLHARNAKYFMSYTDELRPKYGDRYVAIHDCKVVDSDIDLDALLKRLGRDYAGNDRRTIYVNWVYKEKVRFILPKIVAS